MRTKYASASSALFPGYEPTAFSPLEVRTKTVPSSATRPKAEGSPINALAALAWCGKFISVMRVILSARYLYARLAMWWVRCLEDLHPLSVGRVWIGRAKGTLSHGVSVNRTLIERE